MKTMILAAGLGTRLRPLTLKRPKPLMPVGNRPIIDRLIEYLKGQGSNEIIVNAHHQKEQIIAHLGWGRPFGLSIQVRAEPEILGTGGGIKNTEDFWDDDPFVVINGDILTNIDLKRAYESHRNSGNLVTLVLHDCTPFNQVQVNKRLDITNIASKSSPGRFAFTGIHIIEPALLDHIPGGLFSDIIECYRRLIREGMPIRGYISEGHYWRDVGTLGSYLSANKEALGGGALLLGPDCRIHGSTRIRDWAVIGEKANLEPGAEVCRSVLWENVRVKEGVKIVDSVVTSSKEVWKDQIGTVFHG